MSRVKRKAAAIESPRRPRWIEDTVNQAQWNGRFMSILKRNYRNSDSTISKILNNESIAQMCGVKIRMYLDKGLTRWLYGQRKARGVARTKQLKIALTGLKATIDLYTERGNKEAVEYLGSLVNDLSEVMLRCKEAYASKRHGRDRAHSILSECHSFLESELRQAVTHATLATLVNAGFETDGKSPEDPVTEEHIRKNLAGFRRNNPLWSNKIDPDGVFPVDDPATK